MFTSTTAVAFNTVVATPSATAPIVASIAGNAEKSSIKRSFF